MIVATPEYNGSMSGVLKNAVDWLSRLRPMPLAGKPMLLMSTAPGAYGGVRGLWHTRVPFEALGVHTFPNMLTVPNSAAAFDADGTLQGSRGEALRTLVERFLDHAALIGMGRYQK